MFAAKQAKDIVLDVYNEIGVLHQVAKIVAEKGVNIRVRSPPEKRPPIHAS